MLCRRCGMESSTTDVCEWCRRPMLPPGSTVSAQAAKDLKESGQPIAVPHNAGQNASEGRLLVQEDPEEGREEEQPGEDQADRAGVDGEAPQLRPLGGTDQHLSAGPTGAPEQPSDGPSDIDRQSSTDTSDGPAGPGDTPSDVDRQSSAGAGAEPDRPSHGLAEEATRTSVDISQYVGSDQSIFRPIVREDDTKSDGTDDLLKQRARRRAAAEGDGPKWSENERLIRCLVVGLAASLVVALAQFFITGDTVNALYGVTVGRSDNLFTVLKYGIAAGVVLGFGLGALLVRFQKGSGLGFILGVLVGLSLGNSYWGVLPGIIVGIINGRIATLGVRRVVNV